MPDSKEELSAYVPKQLKDKVRDDVQHDESYSSQSDVLRHIIRQHYANRKADQAADQLRVETRIEAVAARVIEDLERAHERALNDSVLAAIYSIAAFELLADGVSDSRARDAMQTAKRRVHGGSDADAAFDTQGDDEDASRSSDSRESGDGGVGESSRIGIDRPWRNEGDDR